MTSRLCLQNISGQDVKELKTRLDSIIDVENEDNLRTHFRQTVLFKDNGKVSGQSARINSKFGLTNKGGVVRQVYSYPILYGQFTPLSQGLEIEFKSKMNIIGKGVFIGIALMLAYGILTEL
jgi:hypothetical protein